MEKAEFREPGVNCEMCHGPSAAHAASPESPAPLRFSKLDHVEATLICGQCHRQSALRNLGPNGEMNFARSEPYYDRLMSQPYGEFGTRRFTRTGGFGRPRSLVRRFFGRLVSGAARRSAPVATIRIRPMRAGQIRCR